MMHTTATSHRSTATRILLVAFAAWAFSRAAATALPVTIDEAVPSLNISRHLEYFEDREGLSIEDIAGKPLAWLPVGRDYAGFGYVRSAYWFRVTLVNPRPDIGRELLEIDFPTLDLVEMYSPDGKGGFTVKRAGDGIPFSERRINDPHFVFRLNLAPGAGTYYMRVTTSGSLRFRARIYSESGFFEARSRYLPFIWLIYGMMLLAALFFLLLFLYIPDRAYLVFALFISSILLHQLSLRGFAFQYLWPDRPDWANASLPFFLNLAGVSSALFLRATLETAGNTPRIDRLLRAFAWIAFPLAAAASLAAPFEYIMRATYYIFMAYGVLVLGAILYLFSRRNRFARYFLAGGVVVVLVNIVSSLTALGAIPSNVFTEWSLEPSYLWLILLASLGMIDRMRALEEGLRRSEIEISRRNVDLARTNEELVSTNEELIASNEEFERQNTELLDTQESLRHSEERLRRLIDNSPVAMAIFDREYRITYLNAKLAELFGYGPEDIASTDDGWRLAFPDEEYRERLRREWRGRIDEARAHGAEIAPLEAVFTARDGSMKYIEFRLSSFGDWNLIIFHDLTERKRYETELSRLATVVHQAEEEIIITDTEGTILYVNPAFERISGYRPEEVTGRNTRVLKSGKHEHAFYRDIWTTITSGGVWKGEIVNRRRDGSLIRLEGSISPIRDAGGAVIGYASIRRDVTERAALEAQLMQAQKMEAVGTLVGGLAHDFNNVLGGIVGSVSVLGLILKKERLSDEAEVRSLIDTMKRSSERAADMIRQLLSLSRKQQMEISPVDLNRSLENVLNLCRGSFPKSVELDFAFHDGPVMVNADPTRIEQAVLNLCLNASHAMTIMRPGESPEGGRLRARTGIVEADAAFLSAHPLAGRPGRYAFVSIADDGVGMDEETRTRIFEPFFTTKGSGGGTGLGLTMVYNIVSQHRGFIDVESSPGKGSVVTFHLPLAESAREQAPRGDQDGITPGTGTVLIVDDEAPIRTVARAILELAGYSVLLAENGEEGVRAYREAGGAVDLVLLDMSMPRMSGIETLAELLKIDPGVRVLLTSGFSLDEKVRRALDRGAAGFIDKPFTPQALTRKIRDLLG